MRNQQHARRVLVDQGDRAVLHFGRRIALGMDVADFLELQRALERGGEIELPAQVEEVLAFAYLPAMRRTSSLVSKAARTLSGNSCNCSMIRMPASAQVPQAAEI